MNAFRYILAVVTALVIIVMMAGFIGMAKSAIPTDPTSSDPSSKCFMTVMQWAVVSSESELFWQGEPSVTYQAEFPCPAGF